MAPLTPATHRVIVVVDVVGFTAPQRILPDRLAVREGMYDVLKSAFTESDVDFGSCATEDRGDGALIVLPPDTARSVVADRLPERVAVALRRYNWTRVPQAQMRLRVAVNAGDVLNDGKGWVGEAVDSAFRILDAPRAKQIFAVSDHMVAFISSEQFFLDVIATDPGLLPDSYTEVPVSVKSFTGKAYLRLHGELAAPTRKPPEPPAEDRKPEVDGGVHEVIPSEEMADLKYHLTRLAVPQLPVALSRALGPAVQLPRLGRDSNAWDAFQLLLDFNAGPDGVPPAITFLRLLAESVGGEFHSVAAGWIEGQARRLRLGPALERQREIRLPLTEHPLLYLTIMLEPVSVDPTRCTLAFWRQDDPAVWPPALGDVREIGFDEIEHRVDDVILKAEDVWSDQSVSAAVEFLLPRELIDLPVQRWAKEHESGRPEPLRYGYRLGIRSLERMRSKRWHRAWHLRWNSMQEDPSPDRLHYSGCEEYKELPIEAVLSDERWVGLVMAEPPSAQPGPGVAPDELTSALRGGLPVVLWHPEAGPEGLRELIDWVLAAESGFKGLPERRKLANSRATMPFKDSLARDLVVMWDDPKRLIVLDQPLNPTRE
ncbi:hypothetical protein [Amycolatopsis magusensis]|uniref:VMAP-C domain-containing protein n=1 Tax=Amycolatopsis magusensis TaxID=882444 RepID=UPI003C309119